MEERKDKAYDKSENEKSQWRKGRWQISVPQHLEMKMHGQ
jgi:hypothetical protein